MLHWKQQTLSCPSSLTRKFRGNATSMNCEANSSTDSIGSSLFFKALTLPYSAFVITRPPISCCFLCFLFATFCNNSLALSAAARASLTCRTGVIFFQIFHTKPKKRKARYSKYKSKVYQRLKSRFERAIKSKTSITQEARTQLKTKSIFLAFHHQFFFSYDNAH